MKLPRIRMIALAAVPVGLAAAMLGPMAGAANAMPRQCERVLDEVYTDWGLADIYEAEGREANAAGDWLAAGYYYGLAGQYNTAGDRLYDSFTAMGC